MTREKKVLTVYLASLTHAYSALANGTFPLGIAYVASALKKSFQRELDIELFKYPAQLESAIKSRKPDIFMFSNYAWSQYIHLAFAKRIKESFPSTLVIGGGPNISKEKKKQEEYLKRHPYIDFYIIYEGEVATCHLVKNYLAYGKDINRLKEAELFSTITLMPGGKINSTDLAPRLMELDDIPSPYLSGLMEEFFDNRLYPLIETNRGCPFLCSYCQQGDSYFNKVAFHSLERVKEELDYIVLRMRKESPDIFRLEIADSNFLMYPRDLSICEHIRKLQEEYSWPRYVGCSTGKNNSSIAIEGVSKLFSDSVVLNLSTQSTNPDTLKAIKRNNICPDEYKDMQTEIHRRNLRSMADVIMGLPLETRKSHFRGIYNLIDLGVQEFQPYTAMVLKSTDLELESEKQKYGFMTKWRLIPRAGGKYEIVGKPLNISEVEEVIVATGTLSFNDYLICRQLHLLITIYHNSKVFELIQAYLAKADINYSCLIQQMHSLLKNENKLKDFFEEFISETKSELFDSEEDCLTFYNRDTILAETKNAERGSNLLFKYLSLALFKYWEKVVEFLLIALKNISEVDEKEARDISKILNARVVSLSEKPVKKDIVFSLESPKTAGLLKKMGYPINEDSFNNFLINMELSDYRYEVLSHAQKVYPNNLTGWSLILAVHRLHTVTRELSVKKLDKKVLEGENSYAG